jgi:hypothetical protein
VRSAPTGAQSSLKSAARAESRATWKQLQPFETGVVDARRVRPEKKMPSSAQ